MTLSEPQVVVPVKLAQAIVDYLKARPFFEVTDLINGLVRAPRAEIQPTAPTIVPKEGENKP